MTTERKYGKPEGLADRLDEHVERLGRDKRLPWLGLGIIDDLQCAARQLRGQPASVPDKIAKKIQEFDL